MISGADYAVAIRFFADAVQKSFPDFDTEALNRFAGECQKITDRKEWKYNLRLFNFPRRTFKETKLDNTRPTQANSYEITISAKLDGVYSKSDDADSINNLEVNLLINSFLDDNSDGPCCAWHLDSHPPVGATGNTDSPFAHPRYHWQYGGNKIWDAANGNDAFYGLHLLLESPRIPHAPLDVILAVDYVLANFYGKIWEKLKDDDDYKVWIEKSQSMYWKPYFKIINSYWDGHLNKDAYIIMPCLSIKKPPEIGKKANRKK